VSNRFLDSLASNGASEMVSRISAHDWQRTPLGDSNDWPQSLKVVVRIALSTKHPSFIYWGPEYICLYNDALAALLGPEHHPRALGMPATEAWTEIWPIIGPQLEQVMRGEGATWHESHLVPMLRRRAQDVSWTYSLSPIDDENAPTGVGGVLVLATETTRQVVNEQRAASDRERLAALFDQAPTFMALLEGPEHVFVLANPSYMRLVGNRKVIGLRVADALPEAASQGYVGLLDSVFRTGQAYSAFGSEIGLEKSPGGAVEKRFLDFVYQPMQDASGTVRGVFVVGADVTEREKAEMALGFQEEQLRLATDAADVGLWDVDLVGSHMYWPARVKAMFGISADVPVTLDDYYKGVHPDDKETTLMAFADAVDPKLRCVYDVEYRTIGKEDGVVRWVAAKGRGLFNENGVCTRVIGTAIDITHRKASELRLKELNETLERRVAEALAERKILADIVEETDGLIQVLDLDFRWLATNRANTQEFHLVFGVRPAVGVSMMDALRSQPVHREALRNFWRRALTGERFTVTRDLVDGHGVRRHYEMRFAGLRDKAGAMVGAYQFAYDVTERLREQEKLASVEAALRQAQKMQAVGQLTGGIAHDFNNILQAVRGAFELIRRRTDKPDVVSLAERGLAATTRGATLTAQLLTFSREQALEIVPFPARRQLAEMESLLRTTVGARVTLALELGDDAMWVAADATQLEMAVINLAINARDAMQGEGTLRLAICRVHLVGDVELPDGDYVKLKVSDTGPGMSPEVAARAFEPFFTTKGVGKGQGLGLSQVYGMAKRVGGAVRLAKYDSSGTTVELLFRATASNLTAKPLQRPSAAGEVVHTTRSLRVLVVDDDSDVRTVIVEALATMGHQVLEAENGLQALSFFKRESVECLVLDFAMPGMNGAELAKRVREVRPDVPILFVSGYSDTAAIDAAVGLGSAMLRKPFDMPALALALDKAMKVEAAGRLSQAAVTNS
jgi:PAS domain S-box-containing protein